ncbi:hypothetical protein RHDC4_00708 [Rhodocyclaceae bacterium]|nr:hypothetical protein RHDC4_00708 [Rhodocyclaceae bacterium]
MVDKALASMSFANFAAAVRPSGAVNRYTMPGTDIDIHSYSVYLNGPLAEQLPNDAREHEFRDVMVNALTEKLGLDSASFRDTMKVAEIVAVRAAYLAAINEVLKTRETTLSDEVMDECVLLADKSRAMTHPWIVAEVDKQMALSMGLAPVLAEASQAVGRDVLDRAPREVGVGKVVAGNLDFTVQQTSDGEIVTHENRRLSKVPAVGEDITVSYYRGNGQVIAAVEKMWVSEPFVEEKSRDLGVVLTDVQGQEQIILFNSMTGFQEFVHVHGLDPQLVPRAMDVRAAEPKIDPSKSPPQRVLEGAPFIEDESRCIGVHFRENGELHSAIFSDVDAMARCSKEYGIGTETLTAARALSMSLGKMATTESDFANAKVTMGDKLYQMGYRGNAVSADWAQQAQGLTTFAGKVVAEVGVLVAQDAGRGKVVVHDLRNLDKVVREGENMTVKYNKGRGQVLEIERPGQSVER